MEDEGSALASRMPSSADGIASRIAKIRRAGEDIVAFAAAAEALARRSATS